MLGQRHRVIVVAPGQMKRGMAFRCLAFGTRQSYIELDANLLAPPFDSANPRRLGTIGHKPPENTTPATWCRFVPERCDDLHGKMTSLPFAPTERP